MRDVIDLLEPLLAWLAAIPMRAWFAVVVVLALQRVVARFGMLAYAVFALPGTLAHEGAHWLLAQLLFAKPSFPTLWPERTAGGWRLGSVAFNAGWWRAVPIAMAPLLLLPLAAWWMSTFLSDASGAAFALHAWIAGTLVNASLPSRADLRLAVPGLTILACGVIVIAWLAGSNALRF